jgi:hypothetical protein
MSISIRSPPMSIDGFKQLENALGKQWNSTESVQITGSKTKPHSGTRSCVGLDRCGRKTFYWWTGQAGIDKKPTLAVIAIFDAMWEERMQAHQVPVEEKQSFSIFMWRPWLWDTNSLEWHVDQWWVGDKFLIDNVQGDDYDLEFVKIVDWDKQKGSWKQGTVERRSIPVPSFYTVHGEYRYNMAHRVTFPVDSRVLVYKSRLGVANPGYKRRVWVMPKARKNPTTTK